MYAPPSLLKSTAFPLGQLARWHGWPTKPHRELIRGFRPTGPVTPTLKPCHGPCLFVVAQHRETGITVTEPASGPTYSFSAHNKTLKLLSVEFPEGSLELRSRCLDRPALYFYKGTTAAIWGLVTAYMYGVQ